MIRIITITAIAALAALPAMAQSYRSDAKPGETLTDSSIPEVGIEQRLGAQVPVDMPLYDEAGNEVHLSDYFEAGKPIVLALVYYECPMLCGETLNGMLELFDKADADIGDDYTVVNISFDPGETPELATTKKTRFIEAYGRDDAAAEGWHFLTAPEASSKAIAEAIGYGYEYQAGTGDYAHASAIVVLTPEGKVSKYFFGVVFPEEEFASVLQEASGGAIGSAIKQAFLRCYVYNNTTGQYSLSVMYLVRFGGVLTVLALAAAVGIYLLREMRARSRAQSGDDPAIQTKGEKEAAAH